MSNTEQIQDTRKTRLVWDYKIARALLKKGNVVVDIKPSKDDRSKPVLIFENTDKFNKDLEEIVSQFKEKENKQ